MTEEPKKMSAAKKAYIEYQHSFTTEKAAIKLEQSKWKRFWKYVWLAIKWPWKWLWMACHDWRLILVYVGWMAIIGCEVWVPLVIAWCCPGTDLSKSMYAVAATCEAFWLGPFTPFMPLCIALTIGTKAIFDKIKTKKEKSK